MTNIRNSLMQAAGTAASGDPVYVEDVFATHLFTGTQSTLAINNGIDLDDKGGLVWFKARNNARNHALFDTERGNNLLYSSTGSAQSATTTAVTATNSNGFTVGSDTQVNKSGETIVAWTFAKQEGFFDVVTWTGNGTAGREISHNLGSTPGMIAVKALDRSENWLVYHANLSDPDTKILGFNLTNAEMNQSTPANLHSATATKFEVGNDTSCNNNGDSYIAYLWASGNDSASQIFGDDGDEAIIKTGTYNGNGSTDVTVDVGFEPQWLMIKRSSGNDPTNDQANSWMIFDNMRGYTATGNDQATLFWNSSEDEDLNSYRGKLTSTGFIVNDSNVSNSGSTYVYMAIRRGPMKEPSAGTDVYNYQTRGGGGSGPPAWIFPHPVDWFLERELGASDDWYTSSRVIQKKYLKADETDATTNSTFRGIFDFQNGFGDAGGTDSNRIAYAWRRYPKVFDVVVYIGNGSGGNTSRSGLTHNLGVAPEMVIHKRLDSTSEWQVGATPVSKGGYLSLTNSFPTSFTPSNEFTATTFDVDGWISEGNNNVSGADYICFLFASLDGISKVGTYTGTGSAINVDCGFSGGARWVMVKRTDASADWYIVSSGRGFGKHLKVDSDADESSTAVLDTLSAGFTVRSDAGNDLNANGGTYIYLAFS
jgi:hypothetical protein